MKKHQLSPVAGARELTEVELTQIQGGMPYTWGMFFRSDVGRALAGAAKDVGHAVTGAVHTVTNAVGDAVKSVGKFLGSLF